MMIEYRAEIKITRTVYISFNYNSKKDVYTRAELLAKSFLEEGDTCEVVDIVAHDENGNRVFLDE